MNRLLVHVEGQTEEGFVNTVLAEALNRAGYLSVGARILGSARPRSGRGGARGWTSVRREIVRHLRRDSECVVATLVDYYGMPRYGQPAWPGRALAATKPFSERPTLVEQAIARDIASEMGSGFDRRRFVPGVLMHEFEALLFSDCAAMAEVIGHPDLAARFQGIRDQFETPEHIDDAPTSAPSKRILEIVPEYRKTVDGIVAAEGIGLSRIRAACPHFNRWMARVERIPELVSGGAQREQEGRNRASRTRKRSVE